MNILWTANLIPRGVAEELGIKSDVLGGWVEAMAAFLSRKEGVKLAVACKSDSGAVFSLEKDGVLYRAIPYTRAVDYKSLHTVCASLIKELQPDIIHIEGTEFLHAKAML